MDQSSRIMLEAETGQCRKCDLAHDAEGKGPFSADRKAADAWFIHTSMQSPILKGFNSA